MEWYLSALKQYAVFTGRARRQEYWMFFLFNIIVAVLLGITEGILGSSGLLGTLYSLAVLIPSVAVFIRRLHDTGRTGWWCLIGLIPLLGAIVLLIFLIQEGEIDANEYGENPKSVAE